MRLAFSTLACPGWTLGETIDAAHRYGYEGLELRFLDGELLKPDLNETSKQRVRTACNEAGLPIICVDTSVRIARSDPDALAAQLQQGKAFLELAAFWDSPLLRVFGGDPKKGADTSAVEATVECLASLADYGQELGVAVALETHDVFASSTAVSSVLEQVPNANAGALWDILHPWRVGESVGETHHNLRERLLHVHIKDGFSPENVTGDSELALLGKGNVPVVAALTILRDSGYDGWLSVEWEKAWHPELAEPEVALPQYAEALRAYLSML